MTISAIDSANSSAHDLERQFPHTIRDTLAQAPYIYIPVGAIEWHGHHNVVGLDGVKAHRQLRRVAARVGGLVYPPIYTGHYTGDLASPHTYMIGAEALRALLRDLLLGFERDGFKKAVILGGHYPNHIFVAHDLAKSWAAEPHTLQVLALRETNLPDVEGDHAALHETSAMLDLEPALVDLARISPSEPPLSPDEKANWIDTPLDHSLHGVVGIDPRHATARQGRENNTRLESALCRWIETGEIALRYEK